MLVPAAMKLLGDRNWSMPRWLEWRPHVSVEGRRGRSTGVDEPAVTS